jgi:hypothetical protein
MRHLLQRIPAVQVDAPHAHPLELGERLPDLLARQLARHRRVPVAVDALEVAAPGQLVIDGHRRGANPESRDGAAGDGGGMHAGDDPVQAVRPRGFAVTGTLPEREP